MRDKLGNRRRNLEYFVPQNLWNSLKRSANQHGYSGIFNILYYTILKIFEWLLHILAQKLPFTGIRTKLHKFRGVKIGKNVEIGYNCILDEVFPDYITIEDNSALSGNINILTHSSPHYVYTNLFGAFVAPVIIKSYSWISINSTIMPGVTIGPYSVVSAGSVVFDNVPPYSVVRGNPAKVIAQIPESIINSNLEDFAAKQYISV